MPHQQKVCLIEIKSKEGIPLLPPFYLYETELSVGGGTGTQSPPNTTGKTGGGNTNGEEPLTEAQKRYLFRLMADQGYEGESATQELIKRLGVTSLKEVTKQEASQLIEQLLAEAKGGVEA